MAQPRDHGGGLDEAVALHGGRREDWIDLSTGINPVHYPIRELDVSCWASLPDAVAAERLENAAREFWNVPPHMALLAAPGASALIARIPSLARPGRVSIPGPTYNEHEAAFRGGGWKLDDEDPDAMVLVHPNNPDGRSHVLKGRIAPLLVIDESFCDTAPEMSLIHELPDTGAIILKSFGKFWGLAGLRLGFAIGDPNLLSALSEFLGPWPVSGPALAIGAMALEDADWAQETRRRLARDSARLDELMVARGARLVGGTTLFRLYHVDDAAAWQDRLAGQQIWSRRFPYNAHWLRLGLPGPQHWQRLEKAL